MKSAITNKTISEIKEVLCLVVREIVLTNEEVSVSVNLNAYIPKKCKRDLEMHIIEKPENIKDRNLHIEQKLTWTALEIRL